MFSDILILKCHDSLLVISRKTFRIMQNSKGEKKVSLRLRTAAILQTNDPMVTVNEIGCWLDGETARPRGWGNEDEKSIASV